VETGVTKKQLIISLGSIVLVLGGLYAVFAYFGITNVQETIDDAGIWAPLVLILAKASTIIIAPLSGSPLYPLAGALFGFWEGALYLILGDMIGGVVAFWISRILGRSIVEKMIGGDGKFLSRALKMMGTIKGFLVARICFAPLPEVVAYGAGLTRINFLVFLIIFVAVGIPPILVLAGLGSILTLDTWWVLPAALLVGIIVVPLGFFLFKSMLNDFEKTR
jgi:uncharacterized membrane protein YdjX (TVP38/TMEM64 family)